MKTTEFAWDRSRKDTHTGEKTWFFEEIFCSLNLKTKNFNYATPDQVSPKFIQLTH